MVSVDKAYILGTDNHLPDQVILSPADPGKEDKVRKLAALSPALIEQKHTKAFLEYVATIMDAVYSLDGKTIYITAAVNNPRHNGIYKMNPATGKARKTFEFGIIAGDTGIQPILIDSEQFLLTNHYLFDSKYKKESVGDAVLRGSGISEIRYCARNQLVITRYEYKAAILRCNIRDIGKSNTNGFYYDPAMTVASVEERDFEGNQGYSSHTLSSFSRDGRYIAIDSDSAYYIDCTYEFPGFTDWGEAARPYLDLFRRKHPKWTEEDFEELICQLQESNLGYISSEGIRAKLLKRR